MELKNSRTKILEIKKDYGKLIFLFLLFMFSFYIFSFYTNHQDDNFLQEMIERADYDQDGLVSLDEFYTLLTKKAY